MDSLETTRKTTNMFFFSFRQPRLHGAPHDWQQGWNRRLLGLPLPEIHRQVLNGFKLTPAITAFTVTPTQFILDTLSKEKLPHSLFTL